MKKISLIFCLIAIIIVAGTNSCKKDFAPASNPNASTLTLVSQLSAAQKVKPQEMLDWFAATMQSTGLSPRWDLAVQTVYNGNHVIEVPTSRDAALFFTKINGVLNVDAYKWLDNTPGQKPFTGKVLFYSFNNNTISGEVFKKGKLLQKKVMNAPWSAVSPLNNLNPPGPVNPTITTDGANLKQRTLDIGGPGTWLDWLACVLSGGTWFSGYNGSGACDVFTGGGDTGSGGFLSTIVSFLSDIFGGGGGGDPDGSDGSDPDGSGNSDGFGGGTFSFNNGSSITVSNVSSGGGAWVSTNPPPCDPNTDIVTLNVDGSINDPCSSNTGTSEWVPAPVSPSYDITNNLDACRSPILIQLQNGNNSVGTILQQMANNVNVAGDLVNFEITYKMVPTLFDPTKPNNVVSGVTTNQVFQPGPNVYSADVQLAQDIINNSTDIYAATTLIHESIHAYMSSLLDRLRYNSMTSIQIQQLGYPEVFDDYVNLLVNDNQTQLRAVSNDPQFDHQYMANTLITTISSALKAYDFAKNGRTQNDEFYWSLAWTGLQDCSTWQSFLQHPAANDSDYQDMTYALTSARMSNILNIIQTERSSQSVNGVTVKGKVPSQTNCYQ